MISLFLTSLKLSVLLDYAKRFVGKPYKWDTGEPPCFDGSGFILEVLQSVGIIDSKINYTADELFRKLHRNEVTKSYSGCLWFKINNSGKAVHVELCIDRYHSIGAKGGDKSCINLERALALNAIIKIRPIPFDLPQKDKDCSRIVFVDPLMELRR